MLTAIILAFGVSSAFAQLTITPNTWNVIGLDSNRPATDGPFKYPVGGRVCNTSGVSVTNLNVSFIWDSIEPAVFLSGTSSSTATHPSLAANTCVDVYFEVEIARAASSFNKFRKFHIEASAVGGGFASTQMGREVFVEKLVSQARNAVQSIVGPATVYVNEIYTYTVNSSTAPGGYEQVQSSLSLSNVIFRVLSVNTTYTQPTGGTNNKIYADACGWNNIPGTPTYRSCVGPILYAGGKAGGTMQTTYKVLILSTGNTTATTLIHDFSGSSYHYNSDYGIGVNSISISALPARVPNINLLKSVTPGTQASPGDDLLYKIIITNQGTAAATSLVVIDPVPANTQFKIVSAAFTLDTSGLTCVISYSNDGGATYAYVPAGGGGGAAAGYDALVTHVKWTFSGSLGQAAPNNTASSIFTVKIK